jgi:hypothetical protein
MADFIRREDALFALQKAERGGSMTALTRLERAYAEIREMPAADVAEVVHGRWIKDDFLSDDVNNAEKCSQCGELIGWFGNLPNYCPNCGARMDGGEDRAVS